MASSSIRMVSNFLMEEKMTSDYSYMEQLSLELSPLIQTHQSSDLNSVYEKLVEAGGQLQGRLLVLDRFGKVQVDSYSQLNGTRPAYAEVSSILLDRQSRAYGIHQLSSAPLGESFFAKINPWRTRGLWSIYYTASLESPTGELLGVVLLDSPLQGLLANLFYLQDQMLRYFLIVAIAILIFSFLFSQILTRPIASLTKGIQRMSKGDFSTRVPVKGSRELRNLATTFNTMSEKLEALDDSRNQFISNASHELKTPLTTMKIMLENLIYERGMPQELQVEFMQDINKEIDRLTLIISDLLTLVQMDTQNMKLNRETIKLSDLLKETLHRLEPIVSSRKQKITLEIQDEGNLYVDGPKIQQVMYNLLNNASKYTQDQGHIHVSLKKLGPDFVLSISDNGPGIPLKDQPHIFDRFYRVDRARSRETGGTGLGLSIVKQIVLLHGGNITVDSQEDQGSKFTVELPAHTG